MQSFWDIKPASCVRRFPVHLNSLNLEIFLHFITRILYPLSTLKNGSLFESHNKLSALSLSLCHEICSELNSDWKKKRGNKRGKYFSLSGFLFDLLLYFILFKHLQQFLRFIFKLRFLEIRFRWIIWHFPFVFLFLSTAIDNAKMSKETDLRLLTKCQLEYLNTIFPCQIYKV